jgi:hypothetical protein
MIVLKPNLSSGFQRWDNEEMEKRWRVAAEKPTDVG